MRLENSILPISVLLAIPALIAVSFPLEALTFRAQKPENLDGGFTAAVVSLGPDAESVAVRAAKSSWRQGGSRKVHVELLPSELPEPIRDPMASIGMRSRPPDPPLAEGAISPFLPSRRAPAPVRIAPGKDEEELPFPRTELLKLN